MEHWACAGFVRLPKATVITRDCVGAAPLPSPQHSTDEGKIGRAPSDRLSFFGGLTQMNAITR